MHLLFTPVSVSVCLSVCPHAYLRNTFPSFTNLCARYGRGLVILISLVALRYAVYVLPVLWMTFHIMAAWNGRILKLTHQDAAPGEKSDIYDCLFAVDWLFVVTYITQSPSQATSWVRSALISVFIALSHDISLCCETTYAGLVHRVVLLVTLQLSPVSYFLVLGDMHVVDVNNLPTVVNSTTRRLGFTIVRCLSH